MNTLATSNFYLIQPATDILTLQWFNQRIHNRDCVVAGMAYEYLSVYVVHISPITNHIVNPNLCCLDSIPKLLYSLILHFKAYLSTSWLKNWILQELLLWLYGTWKNTWHKINNDYRNRTAAITRTCGRRAFWGIHGCVPAASFGFIVLFDYNIIPCHRIDLWF